MIERNLCIRLAAHPEGLPRTSDFLVEDVPLPRMNTDQVLVRNLYMSVDPYMRGRMIKDRRSYIPSFNVGDILEGAAVGHVLESRSRLIQAGTFVSSMKGWREYFVAEAHELEVIEPDVPLASYLGVLGMPGLTAYAGLTYVAPPEEGDTVFISAAAGAVGSTAGQIAKLKGCRVVGCTGSAAKVKYLVEELGFDAAINYREQDLHSALRDACPSGIDVSFENVGGEILGATLEHINVHGRIAVCGLISGLNDTQPGPIPGNLFRLIANRIAIRGFLYKDYEQLMPTFRRQVKAWMKDGKIVSRSTIFSGIERAPHAFTGLFQGDNTGKMVVQLAPDSTLSAA